MDEKKIHEWVLAHNAEVEGLASLPENRRKSPRELEPMVRELKNALLDRIVRYMNRWLCIIRRQTGRPNIIEE